VHATRCQFAQSSWLSVWGGCPQSESYLVACARYDRKPCNPQRSSLILISILGLTLILTLTQADTDLLGEREAMQRSFAEYLSERSDWAATQAAAKAKILGDRYPGVVDDFTIEEVRRRTSA